MDRTARLGHREPGGVSDPVRGRLRLHPERFLAPGHGRRMAARDQDDGRPAQHSERRRRDGRLLSDHHGAGCVDEVAGDRGDRAGTSLARGEHHGQPGRARRVEDREVGALARDADDTRCPGASQAVDDDVGGGGTARHFFAKLSNTGRIRSSAFRRFASEFAYENRR